MAIALAEDGSKNGIHGAVSVMASSPRVSVIIPVRNAASTLEETLQSLRAQSFDDFEALIVNDGSADETAAIAAEWVERDSRFRLIEQAPSGVCVARNTGLAAAKGEWVLFLDGDDWIHADFLTRMLRVAANDPRADVIYCGYCRVSPTGAQLPMIYSADVEKAPFLRLSEDCAFCIHSLLLRRALLDEAGGFDTTLKTSEDWDLWIRLARMGARFRGLKEPLAFYRLRAGSATTNLPQMIKDYQQVVARAHAPDPRVKRGPARYAAGIGKETLQLKCVASAIYLAASEAAHGRSGMAVFDALEVVPDCKGKSDMLGGWLFAGLTQGAGLFAEDIATDIEPQILEILTRVEQASSAPGLARETLSKAARLLLEADNRSSERTLWGVHMQRICEHRPPTDLTLPAGTEYLLLRRNTRGVGLFDYFVPVKWKTGEVPRAELNYLLLCTFRMRRLYARSAVVRVAGFLPFFGLWTVSSLRQIWRSKRERRRRYLDFVCSYFTNMVLAGRLLIHSGKARKSRQKNDAEALALVRQYRQQILGGPEPDSTPAIKPLTRAARIRGPRQVPILMYHRVADEGPTQLAQYRIRPAQFEAQLQFLKRHGFSAVTSADLRAAIEGQKALPPRPVMLTFDDAYCDFYENAFPLLNRYGFTAEVFVVTDKVGGAADWDSTFGPPAPLMGWSQIEELAHAGIAIGSHHATHRRATGLSETELVREGAASRFTLESRLGKDVRALALPFGDYDERVLRVMALCGYDLIYTCDSRVAEIDGETLRLPRLEVMGNHDLDSFVSLLPETYGRALA